MDKEKKHREWGSGGLTQKRGKGGELLSPYWYLCYRVNGKLVQESSKTTSRAKAANMLQERLGQKAINGLATPTAKALRYENLRESFFLHYETKKRKSLRYRKDGTPYLSNIRHLDDWFKGRKAVSITADDVRRFVKSRQEEGASTASINRALAALKRMFSLAAKDSKFPRASIPNIELCKEPPARTGFLEYDAFKKLRAELPAYLRGPVTLAFNTGMRLGEIAALRWSQVDLKNRTIRLNAGETKNDEGRVIPINKMVFEVLSTLPQNTERVFQNDKEPLGQFRKSWRAACIRAGLGKNEELPDGTEVYSGLQFHDLRRSGVRELVQSGVSEQKAMQISGHKTASVFRRYNILSEDDIRDAATKQDARYDVLDAKAQQSDENNDVNLMENREIHSTQQTAN